MLLFFLNTTFAQQNNEFKRVKSYFDYQRFMLSNEFEKKWKELQNEEEKTQLKQEFSNYVVKLDSIENTASIVALITVKNRETLSEISSRETILPETRLENPSKKLLESPATYPGGFDQMRKQISDLFYTECVLTNEKILKTSVVFVVEKDGHISSVKAEGENLSFNRQAEIALYMLPDKFSPATLQGNPVRFRYLLPLSMTFD